MIAADPPSKARLLQAVCRNDFVSFVRKCYHTLSPGSPFHPNWHILAMAYHLEQVRLGKIKRLIINVPPRSLKSITSSVALSAWILGHDPSEQIVAVSYGSELAIKLANDFRAIINAPWYQKLFPGTRISRTKNTETEVTTTRNGLRLATSIDGTLTGRGGNIIIIDDPLKPIDALSDSRRQRVNDWFANTLLSRLDNKLDGAMVVVMQRLHMDDLTGMLLRGSDEWTLLSLPAIAEHEERIQIGPDTYHTRRVGDLLHAEREPLFILDSIRSQLGSDTFAVQYQQAPTPPGGAMIKRHWVCRYDHLPVRTSSTSVIQSWDTASKEGGENDWSVCTTWLRQEGKFYLMDVLRGRFDYATRRLRGLCFCGPTRLLSALRFRTVARHLRNPCNHHAAHLRGSLCFYNAARHLAGLCLRDAAHIHWEFCIRHAPRSPCLCGPMCLLGSLRLSGPACLLGGLRFSSPARLLGGLRFSSPACLVIVSGWAARNEGGNKPAPVTDNKIEHECSHSLA
jgi:hypothetical protein